MSDIPRVVVVLLNWNGDKDTIECIKSLNASDFQNFKIIVVDNDSNPSSPEAISREFPEVEIIHSGHNGGFSFGNNFGIREALDINADYIWLLNNDTMIEADCLSRMISYADLYPSVGLFGNPIYYYDNRDQLQAFGGGPVDTLTARSSMFMRRVDDQDLGFITATSVLIRSQVFKDVGLFDDAFFMYWEDVDFSLRAKEAGWEFRVVPDASVYHKESASFQGKKQSPIKTFYFIESTVLFLYKHSKNRIVSYAVGVYARIIHHLLKGDFEKFKVGYAGARSGFNKLKNLRSDTIK